MSFLEEVAFIGYESYLAGGLGVQVEFLEPLLHLLEGLLVGDIVDEQGAVRSFVVAIQG